MADINEVVVRGKARQDLRRRFLAADILDGRQPLATGGADTGPTPYDLLLAALGA